MFDEWHDYIRLLAVILSIYCIGALAVRFDRDSHDWNTKTRDYWFALLMWSMAGCVFAIQGMFLDRPFTVGFVFLTAAVMVTAKGIHQKGSWGNRET